MAEVDTESKTPPPGHELYHWANEVPPLMIVQNVSLIAYSIFLSLFCLFELRFNVPVNNFSVRSRRSYRVLTPDINKGVNVSCSVVQHDIPTGLEPRTSRFGVRHSTARPLRSLHVSQLMFLIIVNLRGGGAFNRALKLKSQKHRYSHTL